MDAVPPPRVEPLEPRELLSAPGGLSPAVVRHAYGIDRVWFKKGHRRIRADGRGQTIAIVDAYDAPTIGKDLKTFDRTFGLSDHDWRGRFALTKVSATPRPPADPGWALETALDVEWAHAIAPRAHILLVEASSPSTGDLLAAIDYARRQSGVVAVSMSWGGDESPFESFFDDYLTTPYNHIGGSHLPGGVTFITSSGDNGAPAAWPAVSPNVVAVGGTTLHVKAKHWKSETAWAGSGGGFSIFEPQTTHSPDVAYAADPARGFAVYDSTPNPRGQTGWQVGGGTSAGAPQWAALVALIDQGRALTHRGSLQTRQTLRALYTLPDRDFHDITTGNNGFAAGAGYDLVTGRGTPIADHLVKDAVRLRFAGDVDGSPFNSSAFILA